MAQFPPLSLWDFRLFRKVTVHLSTTTCTILGVIYIRTSIMLGQVTFNRLRAMFKSEYKINKYTRTKRTYLHYSVTCLWLVFFMRQEWEADSRHSPTAQRYNVSVPSSSDGHSASCKTLSVLSRGAAWYAATRRKHWRKNSLFHWVHYNGDVRNGALRVEPFQNIILLLWPEIIDGW